MPSASLQTCPSTSAFWSYPSLPSKIRPVPMPLQSGRCPRGPWPARSPPETRPAHCPFELLRSVIVLADLGASELAKPFLQQLRDVQIGDRQMAELVRDLGSPALLRFEQARDRWLTLGAAFVLSLAGFVSLYVAVFGMQRLTGVSPPSSSRIALLPLPAAIERKVALPLANLR